MTAQPKPQSIEFSAEQLVIEADFATSAKTSIFRKKASVPLRLLIEKDLICGSVLNFGKGKYSTDSEAIREVAGNCTDYDYTYAPLDIDVLGGHFQCCYLGYVVNTLPRRSRNVVYRQVAHVIRHNDGKAFFAVRSDKDRGIRGANFISYDQFGNPYVDGVVTSKHTYQIGFTPEMLLNELHEHFNHTRVICYKQGYLIVECSHEPLADTQLKAF